MSAPRGMTAVIPLGADMVAADIKVGILYLFAISSLGVYGVLMAGWASNSKYAFLGAIRSAAQMVSYEVSMGFIIITVLLVATSNTVIIMKPIETSYDTICAAERIAPKKAYFELLAHPAIKTP